MIKIGIIGPPNAGKTTTFNALAGADAPTAAYPFTTIDPNRGMMKLRDRDLEALAAAVDAPDIKHAEVELWDIAGLIFGASHGEGLGNEFLGQMKHCDVLLHLQRITNSCTRETVEEQFAIVDNEIAQFDYKLLRKPFEKARRLAKLYPTDSNLARLDAIITAAFNAARAGTPLVSLSEHQDVQLLRDVGLVSMKPQIRIANIDDSSTAVEIATATGLRFTLNAAELGSLLTLSQAEQQELGYDPAQVRELFYALTDATLDVAQKKQFFTVGHLGVGQCVVDADAVAKVCANEIHESLGQVATSVKVAQLNDFIVHKSWANLAKNGLIKSYPTAKYVPNNKEILFFVT